ncbi:MAG: HK97 family phage prohead protease [Acidimicrobiia bacterium]
MTTKTALPIISRNGHRRAVVAQVHTLGEVGEGMVECYASVFGVEFMEGGSFFRKVRIDKGAFKDSLAARDSFPVFWEHDWDAGPIGHSVEAAEDDHGLKATNQLYVDTDRAKNLWRGMDAGAIVEWSIGFYPLVEEIQKRKDEEDGETDTIVIYKKVDLAEMSVVVRGANPGTDTISVESALAAGLKLGRGGVLTEAVIDGRRFDRGVLGPGLVVEELAVGGARYWAVPVCQAAIPPHSTDVLDEPWDGPGEVAKIPNDAGAAALRKMYAWVDPDLDPETKAAYKLPHHQVTDGVPGAANVAGVRNALSRLPQSGIPQSDHEAVRRHLQRHLDDFAESQEQALPLLPGAARILERDTFRKIFLPTERT